MFGIYNWKDIPKELLKDLETLMIDNTETVYLCEQIPKNYGYKVIGNIGEVTIITLAQKIETTLFTQEIHRRYSRDCELTYKDLKGMQIAGKEIVFCSRRDMCDNTLRNRFKIIIDVETPGARLNHSSSQRFELKIGEYTLNVRMNPQVQILPIGVYGNNGILLMQGNEYFAYFSFAEFINIGIYPEIIKALLEEYAKLEENLLEHLVVSEDFIKAKINMKKQELTDLIESIDSIILTAKKTIIENVRKIPRINASMQIVEHELENTGKTISESLQKIKALPDIKDAKLNNGILLIDTKKLHAITTVESNVKRDVYYGKFTLIINIDTGMLAVYNKEFNYQGKDHPHAFTDRHLCLGTIENDIGTLIGNLDLVNIVAIMIDFLRSANKADCEGAKVVNWPYIENGKIIENRATVYSSPLTLEEK